MLRPTVESASLSWNKAPIWGLLPDNYYCQTVAGLLVWGVLSDERTGLPFAVAAGLHQRSHSRVRIPWDSRPYFTVSDVRRLFSSPPRTRRATVEVFDPASTRECPNEFTNELSFITRGEPKRDHHLELFVCHYLFHPMLRNISLSSHCLAMDSSACIRCHGNVLTEQFSSNGRIRHIMLILKMISWKSCYLHACARAKFAKLTWRHIYSSETIEINNLNRVNRLVFLMSTQWAIGIKIWKYYLDEDDCLLGYDSV
jgi:hypothetical protein